MSNPSDYESYCNNYWWHQYCYQYPCCIPGPPGPKGDPGTPGTPGAKGDPGGLFAYGYLYSVGEQSIESNKDVQFANTVPVSLTGGLSFVSPSTIRITKTGLYYFHYYLYPKDANGAPFALYGNGTTQIAGTNYTTRSASAALNGQAVISVTASTLTPYDITLRNIGTGTFTTDSAPAGQVPFISASLVVLGIAET